MKRWHLTLGLATSAAIAAVLAPRLHAMLNMPDPIAPPIQPVIDPIFTEALPSPSRTENQAQGPLVVTAGLDRTAVLQHRPSERFITIKVRAPDTSAGRVQRTPVNVAVVMDTSGSMQAGGKISHAKRAAKVVLQQMDSTDEFSLITFNDDARVVIPATSPINTAGLEHQIDRIYEGGGTNLYAGMHSGVRQLEKMLESGEVGRMVILSDGKANVGEIDDDALARFAARAASKGISVSAMGLGLDYNEDLLARIADIGGGTYDYIDDPNELESVFANEFHRTATVVAQHTAIDIELPPGVEPLEVIGWDAQRVGNGWSVFMGDVHAGSERKVVLRVRVNGSQIGNLKVASVTANYTDLTEGTAHPAQSFDTATATITNDPNLVASSLDRGNAAAASRAWGNRYLEMSTRAYEKGDSAGALDYLRQGSTALRSAAGSTGSAQLQKDAERLESQADVFQQASPHTNQGRQAIKKNKEFLRNAYR